ncbi:MAG TPA: cytochrome c [Chitinophagaceae bacterium]|nr:cytochrome c [Chitinophagaceae bacterium]
MKKILLRILAVLVIIIAGLLIFILAAWNKKHNAPYPGIRASSDSTVIARGKYLAFGPAHCASCHTPMDKLTEVDKGLEIPLSGGWELSIPPGTFRAPNLTPDTETGIGKLTDAEVARVLRYSVGHDGRTIFPFMPFQELSDEDLTAIISFLRSQKPVKNAIKPTEYSFLGKAVMAFGLIKPVAPKNTPPKSVATDSTVLSGSYIANSIANCMGCHTKRELKTGEFTGPAFAGGFEMAADEFTEGFSFVTPNLTPDPETGIMANWNESTFVSRFRSGRVHKGSPMPWGAFSRMNEVDLKALYRYLKSLDPVKNKIEKTVFAPGEKLP